MSIDKRKRIEQILALSKSPKAALLFHIDETAKEFEKIKDTIATIENTVVKVADSKQGIQGEQGVQGETPPTPKDGVDGKDGKDAIAKDGKDGTDGKDGKDADENKIIKKITKELPPPPLDGTDGKDGEAGEVPEHEWKGTAIRFKNPDGNWGQWMNLIGQQGEGRTGGGNLEVFFGADKINSSQRLHFIAGSGITFASSNEAGGTGVKITSTGGATFNDEITPTGTVNGTNKDFELPDTPTSGSLKVFVNGQRQALTEDYTFTGTTITFVTAPPTGSILLVDFRT